MKAVILAGGLGTRLRPITYKTPKPLVPLVGKPLVMHIIDSLPPRVDTVVLAVSYMKDVLEEYFRVNDCGRKIILVNETTPLGTGGAVKNVEEHLDDTFIVINGDVLTSIDIDSMVKYHREKGGIGTISLWQVENPTAFGVVGLDQDNRITIFQEKPSLAEAVSNMINAGVYVFEPDMLDNIGKGSVSIEKEVFPKVLDQGLYGYQYGGYWVDCGTRESYLKAQRTLMDLRPKNDQPPFLNGNVKLVEPLNLAGAKLDSCSVGPYVFAEKDVTIGAGAVVSNSVLMRGATVRPGAVVTNSLIGPGFVVEKDPGAIDVILGNK
ncbi:MAG TPA: NDP-sugar synthase [Methanomassiliicoccales archaeon]|jgi:mannose-1-phosphate guanylyltransferase